MVKGKHYLKGPKKRTKEEDEAFESAFEALVLDMLGGQEQEET